MPFRALSYSSEWFSKDVVLWNVKSLAREAVPDWDA